MSLTKGEKKEFRKNSICHICEEKIEGDIKVRNIVILLLNIEVQLIPVVILITSLMQLLFKFQVNRMKIEDFRKSAYVVLLAYVEFSDLICKSSSNFKSIR